jgi:hypothetical protein
MINKSPAFREIRSLLLCSQEPLTWSNLSQKDAFHTSGHYIKENFTLLLIYTNIEYKHNKSLKVAGQGLVYTSH